MREEAALLGEIPCEVARVKLKRYSFSTDEHIE